MNFRSWLLINPLRATKIGIWAGRILMFLLR